MANFRTATIITILQELGDDDFKQFKWHLSEYKHIPYFQLENSDRVDTSIKIKKTYGAERGLMFTMDLLKEMNMNDVVSRFSNTVSPPQTREVTNDGGETAGRIAAEWRPSQEGAFPEETRAAQLKMQSLIGGGLLCAIMGNILLVVSTVTDFWEEFDHGNRGLWKACYPKGNCSTRFPNDKNFETPLQAGCALMILACVACFVGIIIGIKSFAPVSPFRRHNRLLAAASLLFFSSVLYISTYGMHEKERERRKRTQLGDRNIFFIS